MTRVVVEKIHEPGPPPWFAEWEKRFGDVKQKAFELFRQRSAEIGQSLDDWLKAEREVLGWSAARLCETDTAYEIDLVLPGCETKSIKVTATPVEIAVHASAPAPAEACRVVWSEFGSGDVYRRFTLPGAINVDRITASLERGLLHLRAEKAPSETTINVKEGGTS